MIERVIDKEKTAKEVLADAIEYLDDATFSFACFVSAMKRWKEKL